MSHRDRILIYWYPTLLAKRRHHNNFGSIKLVNLFFGWTFIGWVVALIWAASDTSRPPSSGLVQRALNNQMVFDARVPA
ncbi:superinfection immunity protein [Tunturiibacter gelidiferens]|uniref:superinfection immunity protein n=1 Tax=Tunturiibacter gelidiferens TaxID=3069689 RepID=UPI003D9AECB5